VPFTVSKVAADWHELTILQHISHMRPSPHVTDWPAEHRFSKQKAVPVIDENIGDQLPKSHKNGLQACRYDLSQKCRYGFQPAKEVPVYHTGPYRPTSSLGPRTGIVCCQKIWLNQIGFEKKN